MYRRAFPPPGSRVSGGKLRNGIYPFPFSATCREKIAERGGGDALSIAINKPRAVARYSSSH